METDSEQELRAALERASLDYKIASPEGRDAAREHCRILLEEFRELVFPARREYLRNMLVGQRPASRAKGLPLLRRAVRGYLPGTLQ